MIFVCKFIQWLYTRGQNTHAVLHISLNVCLINTWGQVTLDQILYVLSNPELRGTLHFINLNNYFKTFFLNIKAQRGFGVNGVIGVIGVSAS